VVIDGNQQVVNPIQMLDVRPTISFNRITESADSAMSASPNSFDETNFHAPRYQTAGTFTSDYERVGPEIHSNTLINNSTNGLFIKIETPVGNSLQPLTVAGRFDDTDIVHVLAENLVIQGSSSEPFPVSGFIASGGRPRDLFAAHGWCAGIGHLQLQSHVCRRQRL
jgi:hypothetical protein